MEPYGEPPDISADAGGAEPMEIVGEEWDNAWPNGPDEPEPRGLALPDRDPFRTTDDEVIDCVPDPNDPLKDDGPPPLTDLNGIALRLCLTGFRNAQEAVRASLLSCNIVKVAAVGYQMFEAGLTLQSTFTTSDDAGAQQTHMFVPKYMSVAVPSEEMVDVGPPQPVNRAPELSSLYQLIGRGFVDMKKTVLPSNWKLNLLSQPGVRNLCKLYGDTELLFSQIGNESIEGRKLTLGTVLSEVQWSRDIWNRRVKRGEADSTAETGHSDLYRLLNVSERHSRPFRNLRYCLSGKKGHWPGPRTLSDLTPDDLLEEGSTVAHADVDQAVQRMLNPYDQDAEVRSDLILQFLGGRERGPTQPAFGDLVLDENVELKRYERVMSHGINVGTREEQIDEQNDYHNRYKAEEAKREAAEEQARQRPHPCANDDAQANANSNQPAPVQGIQIQAELSDYSSSSESDSP